MRAIFISYRREDAEGQAGRLFKDLVEHFGEQAVFMDVAAIEPGRDFRKAIDEHVGSCGVLLSLIGKNWLDAKNDGGVRRLDDSGDFVRLETASALKRDIPVVPVLVHGAQMPRADQLPEDLKDLAYRNAIELTHARWDSDLTVLIKALSRYVTPAAGPAPTAGPAPIQRANTSLPPTPVPEPSAGKSKLMMVGIAAAVVLVAAALFLFKSGDGKNESAEAVSTPAEDAGVSQAPISPPGVTGERKTSFGVADWDRDGNIDVLARDNVTKDLLLYLGPGDRLPVKLPAVHIGNGWQSMTPFGVADWDRNGHRDVVVRNNANEELLVYFGLSKAAPQFETSQTIDTDWSGFTPFGVADWDGDGQQDIIARRDTSGELLLYPGQGTRDPIKSAPIVIDTGWNGFTPFGIADWDHDGHQDIVMRKDSTKQLFVYPGDSKRAKPKTEPSEIGVGWGGFTSFGIADYDNDGNQDILTRNDSTGELMLYPGESIRTMGNAAPVKIGTGF